MEPEAAIAIYQRAKQNGVRYDVLIGDEDSTTISRIRQITGTSLYKKLGIFRLKLLLPQ